MQGRSCPKVLHPFVWFIVACPCLSGQAFCPTFQWGRHAGRFGVAPLYFPSWYGASIRRLSIDCLITTLLLMSFSQSHGLWQIGTLSLPQNLKVQPRRVSELVTFGLYSWFLPHGLVLVAATSSTPWAGLQLSVELSGWGSSLPGLRSWHSAGIMGSEWATVKKFKHFWVLFREYWQ